MMGTQDSTAPEGLAQDQSGAPDSVELAVVIPAFNERNGVAEAVERVRAALTTANVRFEIVVVDDGSTDGTGDAAEATGVRVLRLGINRGYGSALKAGILSTRSTFVAIIDADGTYPGERLPELLESAREVDMVVGSRDPNSSGIALVRRPAKRFLTWLAGYLAGTKIPDLNSGLRVVRRSVLMKFLPILPPGFSFTTTITLSMLCTDHRVRWIPIEYAKRIGSSKIKPVDFFAFVVLVLRTILLFNPLKVFLPVGALCFLAAVAKLVEDVFIVGNLSETAVMAMLTALLLWAVGSLADMLSRYLLGGRVVMY